MLITDPAATSSGSTAAQEGSPKERWGTRQVFQGVLFMVCTSRLPLTKPGRGQEGKGGLRSPEQADLAPQQASDYLQTL